MNIILDSIAKQCLNEYLVTSKGGLVKKYINLTIKDDFHFSHRLTNVNNINLNEVLLDFFKLCFNFFTKANFELSFSIKKFLPNNRLHILFKLNILKDKNLEESNLMNELEQMKLFFNDFTDPNKFNIKFKNFHTSPYINYIKSFIENNEKTYQPLQMKEGLSSEPQVCSLIFYMEFAYEQIKISEVPTNIQMNLYPKVLIADDTSSNQMLIKMMLKREKLDLTFAENGEEAINTYVKFGANIILMDLQMPVMDGWEATKKIREYEKGQDFPRPVKIYALTATLSEKEIQRALISGFDGIISKPLEIRKFIEKIHSILAEK